MEQLIHTLILIHAATGGIALFAGTIAVLAPKGKTIHKRSGKIFYFSLLLSIVISLFVAVLPNHQNPFLFCIGIFSLYYLIGGYMSLSFKTNLDSLNAYKYMSYIMLALSIIMIGYPILLYQKINMVLAVFGGLGVLFALNDWSIIKKPDTLQKQWLSIHITKMMGSFIASVTAFCVVNSCLPGIWNWFTPGILGGIYITYWLRKISVKKHTPAQVF